jgi:hypothetical protein
MHVLPAEAIVPNRQYYLIPGGELFDHIKLVYAWLTEMHASYGASI